MKLLRAAPFLVLLLAGSAHATPFGPTASVGLLATPAVGNGNFTIDSMTGPMAQVGIQVGDWWNSQFMLQFTNATGNIDFNGLPMQGRSRVQTIMGGYQLTFDVFGKQGLHGFTPFLGGGLLIGTAHVEVDASSQDALVQQQIVSSGVSQQNRDGPILELHALAGLRYRVFQGFAVRGELGYSTFGGFFGTWQPKLGAEYTF
ncbi:MAG: hypothetical protein JST54_11160 [Deltaproteobacteria bacterium]|nr:hypothetical protein [Deltaproteobacteria bacterium]